MTTAYAPNRWETAARRRKASRLVAHLLAQFGPEAQEWASIDDWPRWRDLAEEAGVHPPSADTIHLVRAMLDSPVAEIADPFAGLT